MKLGTSSRNILLLSYRQIINKTAPSLTAPYSPGELSDEVKGLILNRYNTYRYIAGLNYDITMDAGLQADAQLGALTLSYNKKITHGVSTIPGMSGTGAISCITSAVGPRAIQSLIDDLGDKNIEAIHRMMILSPPTKK